MARRRRGRRRGRRLGSIITVKRLSGVERISNPSSMTGALLPIALGGGAALLGAIGIRQFVTPTPDNAAIVDNADLIGGGLGLLTGLALWNTASKPAGIAAMTAAALLVIAGRVPAMLAGSGMAAMPANGTAGLGAVVAEQLSGRRRGRGMGAIIMQPAQPGSYGPGGGESVSLHGLGAVIPAAFGVPTYTMGR